MVTTDFALTLVSQVHISKTKRLLINMSQERGKMNFLHTWNVDAVHVEKSPVVLNRVQRSFEVIGGEAKETL